ncbi:MAG: GIY-YIG nuclease family protein [Candidatus Omnitrophota bacterium]
MWYVYILKCKDDTFYTGISTNVENRVAKHNQSKGSKYTRSRRPVALVYQESFSTKHQASRREIEIKKFSVLNKERLIEFGSGLRFPSAQEFNKGASGLRPSPLK